ncbi:pseudouridine synthase [Aestuariibacter sp. A3R04]|uniref:pseudouridine synthase n=1 Tax=Aestuariibacter sp. A3R04 TaxID=2841571 RepID=UPI001C0A0B13|nr:pseudouridine synthase [Aestuariibacter sp. A3R04]MBU3022114.1 tRNA pseudouridine(65) synthase TruC [Aestuariibacter sp. A3R04]
MNVVTEQIDDSVRILYQDDYLVVMDKPPGLLVHRSPIDKRETEFAVQKLRDVVGRHVFPVHRLDRPTSGILVFAFDGQTASKMGQAMMAKQIEKQYTALVRGWLKGAGFIDYALRFKADKFADAHRVKPVAPQEATTEYSATAHYRLPFSVGRYSEARYTLVKLRPFTGRKHQLRRHLVHLRHPIIGDTTHGDGKQNKFAREELGFRHLALSCTCMTFTHPVTGEAISVSTQPHEDFLRLLADIKRFSVEINI